jgi:hypothetical protein
VNILAKYQAMPKKIVAESFALNYYINIQGLGNEIPTNNQGRAFVSFTLFSTSNFIIF